jgi:hypothetical protein
VGRAPLERPAWFLIRLGAPVGVPRTSPSPPDASGRTDRATDKITPGALLEVRAAGGLSGLKAGKVRRNPALSVLSQIKGANEMRALIEEKL